MREFDFDATVEPDRRLTLQLPADIAPGEPRVTVEDTDDPILKRFNGVRVWTGQLLEDTDETRRRLDNERMLDLFRRTMVN